MILKLLILVNVNTDGSATSGEITSAVGASLDKGVIFLSRDDNHQPFKVEIVSCESVLNLGRA